MTCKQSLTNLSDSFRMIFGCINIIICLLSMFGNILIFIVIYRNTGLRTRSNCCLVSLAMTDFLVGIALEPLFIIQMFSSSLAENCTLNSVRRFLTALLTGASMGTIALISYDRFMHLSKTVNYSKYMTKLKVIILIALCWLLPLTNTFFKYIGKDEFVYSISIFIYATLMAVIIAVSYVKIMRIIKQKKRQLSKTRDKVTVKATHRSKEQRTLSTHERAAKAIAIIVAFFALSVAPISCYHGMSAIKKQKPSKNEVNNLYVIFYSVAMTISMANSIINPFIYYYRVPGFSETAKKVVQFSKTSDISAERSNETKDRVDTNERKLSNVSAARTFITETKM